MRRGLLALAVVVVLAVVGIVVWADGGQSAGRNTTTASTTSTAEANQEGFDLAVIAQSCDTDKTTNDVIVTGSAHNVSGHDLSQVVVMALFLNADGALVTQAEGAFSDSLITKGAVANFRVSTGSNTSGIQQCVVRFTAADSTPLRVDYSAVQQQPAAPPPPTP